MQEITLFVLCLIIRVHFKTKQCERHFCQIGSAYIYTQCAQLCNYEVLLLFTCEIQFLLI